MRKIEFDVANPSTFESLARSGWFQEELSWKLGCGDKVKFWEEVWVGSSDLKSLFPRLFSLSLNHGQTVGEVGVWINSDWRWRLTWRRV